MFGVHVLLNFISWEMYYGNYLHSFIYLSISPSVISSLLKVNNIFII